MYVQTQNPGWQEVIWDEAAVLKLIQDDFPWFLDTYLSYSRLVQRSDVMRYMALYKYGGVYLDADVSLLHHPEAAVLCAADSTSAAVVLHACQLPCRIQPFSCQRSLTSSHR